MATPFIPTGITLRDCPDQLAQERNDNAKTIKMDGAIRSGANREFEVLCSFHSIAGVRCPLSSVAAWQERYVPSVDEPASR
jgi:hypothetical protein